MCQEQFKILPLYWIKDIASLCHTRQHWGVIRIWTPGFDSSIFDCFRLMFFSEAALCSILEGTMLYTLTCVFTTLPTLRHHPLTRRRPTDPFHWPTLALFLDDEFLFLWSLPECIIQAVQSLSSKWYAGYMINREQNPWYRNLGWVFWNASRFFPLFLILGSPVVGFRLENR